MKCSKQYAFNKATRILRVIKSTRTIHRVMLSVFKTLLGLSNIVLTSAWNPNYKKDKELIEKVQRRFTKMINNMEGKTYEESLHSLSYGHLKREGTDKIL